MKLIFAVMALGTFISTVVAVGIVGRSGAYNAGPEIGMEYPPESRGWLRELTES